MKKTIAAFAALMLLGSSLAHADPATEKAISQVIMDSIAYTGKNLKGMSDEYSRDGALEFWSSGGLMQEITATTRPSEFVTYNVVVRHVHVLTLVPGQAAVAHYYLDGSMQPKGSPAVNNYRTRVSQVFVMEDGKWKIRSSHWSPMSGGAGTSQTALVE